MSRCAFLLAATVIGLASALPLTAIDADHDFSGAWVLDPEASNPGRLLTEPEKLLSVLQGATEVQCSSFDPAAAAIQWSFSTDGRDRKYRVGTEGGTIFAKWEGSALLVTTIVSAPRQYTVTDHWTLSQNHQTFTIERQIADAAGQREAKLVYRRAGESAPPAMQTARPAPPVLSGQPVRTATIAPPAPLPPPSPPALSTRPGPPAPTDLVVPSGTRILLDLVSSVSTKRAKAGDHVYLETAMAVAGSGHMLIPRGSGVQGTVTAVKRPAHASPQLSIRFDTLTLPNGVTRDLQLRPDATDAKSAQVTGKEGEITGTGGSNTDQKIYTRTETGATVGVLTGAATGMGAATLGAAGAIGGLASVLLSHPDVVLPRGTTMEMVLDYDLKFQPEDLGY
ncbi:MAG: hypothetical protein ABSC23_10090 [Bryobacteraceae bacterium]|jgi:type IV secretion system protein VirB10